LGFAELYHQAGICPKSVQKKEKKIIPDHMLEELKTTLP
jgi:hypothetical protein